MDQEKLQTWVRKRLVSVSPKCAVVQLVHVTTGSPAVVCEFDVASVLAAHEDIESAVMAIADEAWNAATASVESFPRPQQYAIVGLSSARQTIGSQPFRLRPPADGIATEESEPATGAGALAQMMRHNESYARLLQQGMGMLLGNAERRLAQLESENGALRAAMHSGYEALEAARSQQHERELQTLQEVNAQENKALLIAEAKKIVPLVAGHMRERSVIKKLADSLDADQLDALVGLLRPEQLKLVGPALLAAGDPETDETKEKAS
jgi:hypothetical protein